MKRGLINRWGAGTVTMMMLTVVLFSRGETPRFVQRWLAVNVRDYGAVGNWNGTTGNDDTTAIQAAIDYANGHHAKVYVPETANSYKISQALQGYSDIVLFGDGYRSRIAQTGITNNVLNFDGKTNFVVRGLHLQAKGDFSSNIPDYGAYYCGLWLRDCADGVIEDCVFTGYAYAGIFGLRSDRIQVRRNRFPEPGWANPFLVQQQTEDISFMDSRDGIIEQNECVSQGTYPGAVGIGLDGGRREASGGAPRDSYGMLVRNNRIERKSLYAIKVYNHVISYTDRPKGIYQITVEGNKGKNIDGSYHHIAEGTNYSKITSGTGAGTAIYMQTAYESVVRNNEFSECSLFTRNAGTHTKGVIGYAGVPDAIIKNNKVRNGYFTGINVNNSAGQGDTNRLSPSIVGNEVEDSGVYVAVGTATSGSPIITLRNPTAPLEPATVTNALGGFWIGDLITCKSCGKAGADLEGRVIAINAGAGTLTMSTNSSLTSTNVKVLLSDSSGSPPSTRAGILAGLVQRPWIVGNKVTKSPALEVGKSRGISVLGAGPGAKAMAAPKIAGNEVRGGYTGVLVANAVAPLITENKVYSAVADAFLVNQNVSGAEVIGNSAYQSGTGIRIDSFNGVVSSNLFQCMSGIRSSGKEKLIMNNVKDEHGH